MKYIILTIVWVVVCTARFIWEFKTVPFKALFEEEEDAIEFD